MSGRLEHTSHLLFDIETAPRTRMLWFEMAEPTSDPRDAYSVSILAHSPDPLLLAKAERMADPVMKYQSPLDPELVRVIVPGQADDFAGLATMQKLIPASGSDRHYIVPLAARNIEWFS
jgi:hypothetical protein